MLSHKVLDTVARDDGTLLGDWRLELPQKCRVDRILRPLICPLERLLGKLTGLFFFDQDANPFLDRGRSLVSEVRILKLRLERRLKTLLQLNVLGSSHV